MCRCADIAFEIILTYVRLLSVKSTSKSSSSQKLQNICYSEKVMGVISQYQKKNFNSTLSWTRQHRFSTASKFIQQNSKLKPIPKKKCGRYPFSIITALPFLSLKMTKYQKKTLKKWLEWIQDIRMHHFLDQIWTRNNIFNVALGTFHTAKLQKNH